MQTQCANLDWLVFAEFDLLVRRTELSAPEVKPVSRSHHLVKAHNVRSLTHNETEFCRRWSMQDNKLCI